MAKMGKYQIEGLNQQNVGYLQEDVKSLTNAQLKSLYEDVKQQLERLYVQEQENSAVVEQSQLLDTLINEMYFRGIV